MRALTVRFFVAALFFAATAVAFANPFKSNFVKPFTLTPKERAAVLAFLRSLTDSVFITREEFSDPWTR